MGGFLGRKEFINKVVIMKIEHIDEGVGRIIKGVNTTVDVGVNQTSIEAAKFGNKVDKDGRPPTLSKKVKGKSTNVMFNLGMTERKFTDMERAVMEGGHSIDDLNKPTPSIAEIAKMHSVPVTHVLKQLEMGIQAEYEHTSDFKVAKEIALDHIAENPNYYDHLKFIEASYDGNVGIMELFQFFQTAPSDVVEKVKELIKEKQDKEVWKIVQQYTGTTLKGKEFSEDIELDEGIVDSILEFLKPYVDKAKGKLMRLRGALKQEFMETDLMWEILQKGDKARPFEVEFANKQFKDVLKGVGLGAWLALPIPGNTIWITMLEKFLNKFDVSIMPDEFKRQVFNNSVYEKWSRKYKRSINCNNPKGFSQKAHCAGRKKK